MLIDSDIAMPLSQKNIAKIKEELDNCKNPLFFFDDDPDGLCSFLLCYKYVQEGKGTVVKARPRIDETFLRKVEEFQPDKIFVLDVVQVDQEFIDKAGVPVVWIDHHEPQERKGVRYFNPRIENPDDGTPVTYHCYKAVDDFLWLGMIGCVSDWHIPDFAEEFASKYPGLFSTDITDPGKAIFDSPLSRLIMIFRFSLKGKTSDVMKCAKILTRIDDPYELLNEDSPRARFVTRYYKKINREFEKTLNLALAEFRKQEDRKINVFHYSEKRISLTKDLSDKLLSMFPDKVIIIARDSDDEMKVSLRSPEGIDIASVLEEVLVGIEGYGGGHPHASGACIKKHDWNEFLRRIEEQCLK